MGMGNMEKLLHLVANFYSNCGPPGFSLETEATGFLVWIAIFTEIVTFLLMSLFGVACMTWKYYFSMVWYDAI